MFLVPMTRNASELARSFDRLFDDSFERFFAPAAQNGNGAPRSPALDVAESDSAYTVKLDLPGVAKDDVKVSIDGRRVSIEAQTRKDEEKKEGDRVVYRERSVSSFARSFTLAAEVDQAASNAKLDNGVLTLTLAKRNAPAAARLTVD
jgi:HSP20 family protein